MSKEVKPDSGCAGPSDCSALPVVQVLEYQPELTHSVWIDYAHRRRSLKTLEAELRKGVMSGEFVGYRLMTIHKEQIGISRQNASLSIPGGESEYDPRACSCRHCNPNARWMVVCSICGNKRCPHATDHRLECTHSNEPNQQGSIYGTNAPHKPAREKGLHT